MAIDLLNTNGRGGTEVKLTGSFHPQMDGSVQIEVYAIAVDTFQVLARADAHVPNAEALEGIAAMMRTMAEKMRQMIVQAPAGMRVPEMKN